jgi:hypothetical protein
MSHLAIELLTGSVLCLLHLGIGLAVGTKIGRSSAVCVPGQYWSALPRAERTEVQRLVSQWFDLRLRLTELASCARQFQQMPQELLAQWQSELVQLTNELCQGLGHKLRDGDAIAASNAAHSLSASDRCLANETVPAKEMITNAQILELLDGQQLGFESHDESLPLVRYRFSTKQPLAPAVNNGPLAAEAFSMVQFHDLSIRDVRYFVDDLPTEDKVVIGLGVPQPVKWFAAEVEDSRSAFMYGRVGYLVTARLLASIDKRGHVASPELVEHSV